MCVADHFEAHDAVFRTGERIVCGLQLILQRPDRVKVCDTFCPCPDVVNGCPERFLFLC